MVITYTLSTNIDQETNMVIDESLKTNATVASESEIDTILGTDNTLISKWDDASYATMLSKMKAEKIDSIDAKTASDIIALVGNENTQRNTLAASVSLVRKEAAGTATQAEKDYLVKLEGDFAQVETLITEGNAKELEVSEVTHITDL